MLRKQALVTGMIALALISGCKKKTKAKTLPAAATVPAPTVTEKIPGEVPVEPTVTPLPTKPTTATNTKPKPKPKRKPSAATVTAPPASAQTPATQPQTQSETSATTATNTPPPRITITGGGSNEPSGTISAGMSHTEEAHHKLSATQLIDSTEDNLRQIKRALSNNEQGMLRQIQSFIAQAREAIKDNDMVRAHNLALKGHLLSDELVRRQ
jgi:hypothetical protein